MHRPASTTASGTSEGGPAARSAAGTSLAQFWALARAMRPEQWVKNLLVFAALVFSQSLGSAGAVARSVGAFVAFCLAASATYLFNDLGDRFSDRLHPAKCRRPLASGALPVSWAWTALVLLALAAVLLAAALRPGFGLIVLGYLVLNVAYSRVLKHEVILDVLAIAVGFVLRAWGGGVVIGVTVTPWLLLCTLMLALLLGFGKRRHELTLLEANALHHRPALGQYSVRFLDMMMTLSAGVVMITYALYTLAPETVARFDSRGLVFSTPSVIYGVCRYLYLVHERQQGGDPARVLLGDARTLLNVLVWIALVSAVIYGPVDWLPR